MVMKPTDSSDTTKEISCRVTRTLLMYVRENNGGSLGNLLEGLVLDEAYLSDPNHWVSHAFLQILYDRMLDLLGDSNAVYKMTLASERYRSLGLLDTIVRLIGNPKLVYSQAPRYNKLLKLNGTVIIHDIGDTWVLLEDRYHDSDQKTRHDCDYTRGVIAGIPTMFGLPEADVEEIECQVNPDRYGYRIWPDKPQPGCRVACTASAGAPASSLPSGNASSAGDSTPDRPSKIFSDPTAWSNKNMTKSAAWQPTSMKLIRNLWNRRRSWRPSRRP